METNFYSSPEYIEKFFAGYFDELVENKKPFLRDIGINISDDVTIDQIPDKEREQVEEAVLTLEEIIHDRVPFDKLYSLAFKQEDCRRIYFYNKMQEVTSKVSNPVSEKSKELFGDVLQYGYDMDIEEIYDQVVELQKKKRKNFKNLLEENYDDVIACCPELENYDDVLERVTKDDFVANTEGVFEKHLACVMVLKANDMFNNLEKHKITDVKLINGGYFNDGVSDGLTFNFDDEYYEFSNLKDDYSSYNKISLNKKTLKAIEKFNESCNNSMDFLNVKVAEKVKDDGRVK